MRSCLRSVDDTMFGLRLYHWLLTFTHKDKVERKLKSVYDHRVGLLCLIIGIYNPHQGWSEVYTYEKDGVIVLSSEPPPRRARPARRTSTAQRSRASKRESEVKRDQSAPLKKKWKPTGKIARQKEEVKRAAELERLPHQLIWSVIAACADHPPPASSISTSMSCLLPTLKDKLSPQDSGTAATSEVKSAASLLRRLVNYYRGDVTLVLSAYPYAARDKHHPTWSEGSPPLSLSSLLTQPSGSSEYYMPRDRRWGLAFTRRALEIYHKPAEEGS